MDKRQRAVAFLIASKTLRRLADTGSPAVSAQAKRILADKDLFKQYLARVRTSRKEVADAA